MWPARVSSSASASDLEPHPVFYGVFERRKEEEKLHPSFASRERALFEVLNPSRVCSSWLCSHECQIDTSHECASFLFLASRSAGGVSCGWHVMLLISKGRRVNGAFWVYPTRHMRKTRRRELLL